MIFVSTGGFKNISGAKTASIYLKNKINKIELSGGIYDKRQLSDLEKMIDDAEFLIHNYFPPPENPFVFNLASINEKISIRSIEHVKNALQWSNKLGCKFYSFHAGYLLDPNVSELGGSFKFYKTCNRKSALYRFIHNVRKLANEAKTKGQYLLVENNVVSQNTFRVFGENPFLLSTSKECLQFMSKMPSNVGLLIDVAHLKVSANSLNFNPVLMLKECEDFTYAYHLSDNDGKSDTNCPITEESWFWPYLKRNAAFYTLEIYNVKERDIINQVQLTKSMLTGK